MFLYEGLFYSQNCVVFNQSNVPLAVGLELLYFRHNAGLSALVLDWWEILAFHLLAKIFEFGDEVRVIFGDFLFGGEIGWAVDAVAGFGPAILLAEKVPDFGPLDLKLLFQLEALVPFLIIEFLEVDDGLHPWHCFLFFLRIVITHYYIPLLSYQNHWNCCKCIWPN